MAEKISTYKFPGMRCKYDWDLWMNGSIYRLRKGEDFSVSVTSMRAMAYNVAAKRGLTLLSKVEDDSTLVISTHVSR